MLCAANLRYLEFISAIDTPTAGIDALRKISASVHEGEHSYPGFKLFDAEDQALMETLVRGEHCMRGLSKKALRQRFPTAASRKSLAPQNASASAALSRRLAAPITTTSRSSGALLQQQGSRSRNSF
jgi:hypothetical protein